MSHYDCKRCGRYPTDCDCAKRDAISATKEGAAILECIDIVKSCNDPHNDTFYGEILTWSPQQHMTLRRDAIIKKLEALAAQYGGAA